MAFSFQEVKKLPINEHDKKLDFIIEPYIRFKGETGEQGTMFFSDPSGNAIEFKAFRDIKSELFAK